MFAGRFSKASGKKCLILFERNRISYSQVYPFMAFADEFRRDHDAEFRLVPTDDIVNDGIRKEHSDATHILLQTWLLDPPEKLNKALERISELKSKPRLIYLDSFANNDVRLAEYLKDFDLYYKKSIPRDTSLLLKSTRGHTYLGEFYDDLYGNTRDSMNWGVPPEFIEKLRLSPNFLTDPDLMKTFLKSERVPSAQGREIDVHARLGGMKDKSWYGAMRRDADERIGKLEGIVIARGGGISRKAFMRELTQSKVCFSPFGYGELCWRDIEAFASGSVLLKPDMSHLMTEPDLYRDGETYVSIKWDLSDLEGKISDLLTDDDRREHIARTAWKKCKSYLEESIPVRAYNDIF